MNRFNNMNDDELKSFVKQNQPEAPKAESGELSSLMRKLKLKEPEAQTNPMWMWLSTGIAASVFMFHFLVVNPINPTLPEVTQINEGAAVPASVAIEEEEDFNAAPTLDIGEEYLTLAGY